MPEKDETFQLNYADLKIVMETYQNVVQLNTILVEQQKQILELQKEITKCQNTVSDRQKDIKEKIEKMITRTEKESEKFHQEVKELDAAFHARFNTSEGSMHGRFDTAENKIVETKDAVTTMNLDITKQHSGLTNKLYVALVGSGLIILALIGLLTASVERFSLIGHIHEMIEKIITFMKIS